MCKAFTEKPIIMEASKPEIIQKSTNFNFASLLNVSSVLHQLRTKFQCLHIFKVTLYNGADINFAPHVSGSGKINMAAAKL